MEFYFTSDTHYGHKNIVEGVSEWSNKEACRNFSSLEEHNQTLIDNINITVKPEDILYHAGDWSFGGLQNIYEFRKQINCKTIHLTLGNHDHHIKMNRIIKTEDGFVNSKDLFTTVDKLIEKTINGQKMIICHYPFRSWQNGAKGSWMLFGHCHGSLPDYHSDILKEKEREGQKFYTLQSYKTMDIGIDTHPEFRPYHFDELAEIMKDRMDLKVDHHA